MQIPKGILIPIGGNDRSVTESHPSSNATYQDLEVLKGILQASSAPQPRIEIIPAASGKQSRHAVKSYVETFKHFGNDNVGVMEIYRRTQTASRDFLRRLDRTDIVFFTGGDQSRFAHRFEQSLFLGLLKERYSSDDSFIVAGTGAGAMAMSSAMILNGDTDSAIFEGKIQIGEGFGLCPNLVIDTHFISRDRYGRLITTISRYPELIGIGLCVNTGVVIRQGRYLECIGSQIITIFDGSELLYNNKGNAPNEALGFERMIMHILPSGHHYDLIERKRSLVDMSKNRS